jgi:hypothetical protein
MSRSSGSVQLQRSTVPLLVFLLSFGLQVASLPRAILNVYDEGLIVVGAQRVLEGDIPYRDFWTIYAPGQFYAVAGLFSLFGSSILVEQLWDVAVRAAIVAAAFVWTRRLGAGCYAHAAALTVLLILAGAGFHAFPTIHALLFGLISAYLVLIGFSAVRPAASLFAAGLFAGVAALFRHDIGFYFFAAAALALVLQPTYTSDRRVSFDRPLRKLLLLAFGALAGVGPVAAWLLIKVPAHDLWFSLFAFPATSYVATRALPFPELPNPFALASTGQPLARFCESFLIYFPPAAGVAAVLLVLRRSRDAATGSAEALWRFGILLLGLITLLAYLKGIVRVSSTHLLQSIVPATILVFVLAARISRLTLYARLAVPVLAAAFAFSAAATHAQVVYQAVRENWFAMRSLKPATPAGLRAALAQLCEPQPGLERARCFRPRPEDAAIVKFLQQRTDPDEPVYVGTARHDRIFVNNVMLYFLAARRPATKWHDFNPGIQNTAVVQEQIIKQLHVRNVRYLILSSEWSSVTEPNASATSSGITLLDDYIRTNFTKVREFSGASAWERKDSHDP